jgi:hypothetical protein
MTTKNQIIKRIAARASQAGSTASTLKGRHRAAMRDAASLPPLPSRGEKAPSYQRRNPTTGTVVTHITDYQLAAAAEDRAREDFPRRENWESARPGNGEVETIDHGQYSRSCTYRKLTYRPTYLSRATIDPRSNRVVYETAERNVTRKAPAGLYWSHDKDGLKLIRRTDGMDYHPTREDLHARDFAARIRRTMAANYRRRALVRRLGSEQAVTDYLLRSNRRRVSLRAISRAAGNCAAGTESFLARLGIANRERATAGAVYRLAKLKGEADNQLFRAAARLALGK